MSIINFSSHSIFNGLLSIDDIINQEFTKKTNHAFITDMNTLLGVPEFVDKCQQKGITPIIGVTMTIKDGDNRLGNIVLYAKNKDGYKSLKKIVSSTSEAKDKEKTIDFDKIINNSNGLIAMTGGFDTVLYNSIKNKDQDAAAKHLYLLRKCFGDDIYFDIQKTSDEMNDSINKSILNIAKKNNVPVFATNNNKMRGKAHYPLLIEKIKTARLLPNKDYDNKAYNLPTDYVKTSEQLKEEFKDNLNDISNPKKLFDKVEKFNIFVDQPEIPSFPGITNDNLLFETINENFNKFIKKIPINERKKYEDVISEEVALIKELNFEKYFMIFVQLEKNKVKGQRFNMRGSAISFLTTHLLGLSDIDPVEYDLLPERFLNKNRLIRHELPDMDLESNLIQETFRFMVEKFGVKNVAYLSNITKPSSLPQVRLARDSLKSDIKTNPFDANGKERKFPEAEFDTILKILGGMYGSGSSNFETMYNEGYINRYKAKEIFKINGDVNSKAFKYEYYNVSTLKKAEQKNKNIANVIGYVKNAAPVILAHNFSPGSVVISNSPISDTCATQFVDGDFSGTKKDIKIYLEGTKEYAERLGFIKLDILPNVYLDKLSKSYDAIGLEWGNEEEVKYGSKEVFDMLSNGYTETLNQIKSPRQRELAKKVGIENFSELAAFLALIRPGVGTENIDEYLKNKNNKDLKYSHPSMKDIFEKTYGILIFEEQLMLLSQKIGGFSKEKSDDFRSLMKKVSGDKTNSKNKTFYKLDTMIKEFEAGAIKNNIPKETIKESLDIIEKLKGYAFSKAHSLAYASLTYKQAFVEVHYPAEYAQHFLLNKKFSPGSKVAEVEMQEFINKAQSMNRELIHIDINRSEVDFKTRKRDGKIYIDPAIGYITKNKPFSKLIVDERNENGNFKSIFDFIERLLPKFLDKSLFSPEVLTGKEKVNPVFKAEVLKLVQAGAFDRITPIELKEKGLPVLRTSLSISIEKAMELTMDIFNQSDFEYNITKDALSLDNIKKDEEILYGYSPLGIKDEKRKKEELLKKNERKQIKP